MKIAEIHVDSFGHWRGLHVPDLSSAVTVIHGPNEAGKSTLLQLIRAVLYGYTVASHQRFVPPRFEGRVGGQLITVASQGRFQIGRHLPPPGRSEDFGQSELSVKSLEGSLQGRHLLGMLLAGVDESIFQNVFAVGLSEMQQLGTLSDTEAARQLYGLAAGGDRVSIADVAQQLCQTRQRLVSEGAGSLESLHRQQDQLRHELTEQASLSERWFRLRQQRQEISGEIEQLERRQQQFGELIRGTEPSQVLRDHWRECRRLHRGLRSLGSLPKMPASAVQRLGRLGKQLREHRQSWEGLRQRRRKLRSQANKLPGQPSLLAEASQIESLYKRRARMASLAEQLQHSRKQAEEMEFELQGELERMGLQTDWRMDALPLMTDATVATLREPSQQLRAIRDRIQVSEQQEQESGREEQRLQQQLETRLQSLGQSDLGAAVQRLKRQADLLRRAIELDHRAARLQRKLKETRKESHHWIQRQIPSWRGLMVLGAVFTMGVIVVLVGLFGSRFGVTEDRRGLMALVGGAISLASVVMKNASEFAANRNLSSCRDEMESLRNQLVSVRHDREELQQQLPASSEPLTVCLQQTQETLDQLLELQPLAERQQAAQQQAQALQQQQQQTQQQLQQAEQQWRDALRSLALPEMMTPPQFELLSQANSPLDRLRTRLLSVRQELDQQQTESQTAQQQVEQLCEKADLIPEQETLEKQIEELAAALKTARQSQSQRDALYRQWRQLGREQDDVAKAAKRLRESRSRLLQKYGINDSRELAATLARRARSLELQKQRDARLKQLVGQLGDCLSLDDLRQELENGDFETRLQGLEGEQKQVAARLATLHERRGELSQQLKTMAGHGSATSPRLQLEAVRQQIVQVGQRWLALQGVSLALDTVRRSYESDRQPETLAEASSYLKRLTAGRYQRIWTPFGESALCVDDQQAQAWRVEALSRGTREQVYLSLRLALASAYGCRGAGLPLILDDVFVNFDAARARAAAETVYEFAAAGHQVLVFTCHDHIRDLFRSLDVDIRCLPKPEDVAESGQPVLREIVVRDELKEEISVPTAPAAEPTCETTPSLPVENDPELDLELLYGAPRFDPGYELPTRMPAPETVAAEPPPAAAPESARSAEAYLTGYRDALRESRSLDLWETPPDEPERVAEPATRAAYADYDHWPPLS